MINSVILVGRITKDPEVKTVGTGNLVCDFTLAVNRAYQSSNGEKEADFINCQVWKNQAENIGKYVHKGQLLGVEGEIRVQSYTSNGVVKYKTYVLCSNVQYLERANNSTSNTSASQEKYNPAQGVSPYDYMKKEEKPSDPFDDLKSNYDITNDDLPF